MSNETTERTYETAEDLIHGIEDVKEMIEDALLAAAKGTKGGGKKPSEILADIAGATYVLAEVLEAFFAMIGLAEAGGAPAKEREPVEL